MNQTMKANDAADMLGLIPSLVGYHPQESVVAVLFNGRRSIGAMRFDAPADDEANHLVATQFIHHVSRADDVTAVYLVVYSATRRRSLADELYAVGMSAFAVIDVVTVDDVSFWSRNSGEHRLLSEIRWPAEMPPVPRGQAAPPLPEPVEIMEAEGRDLPDEFHDPVYSAEMIATGAAGGDVFPVALGVMAFCMARPSLRDVMLIATHSGADLGHAAFRAQVAWENGEPFPAEIAGIMWGQAERPDPARLERALDAALLVLVSSGHDGERAGAASYAAWMAWALGRSTHALEYAQRALEIEPEHGLGQIVRTMVDAGHLPNWAYSAH